MSYQSTNLNTVNEENENLQYSDHKSSYDTKRKENHYEDLKSKN